MLIIPQMRLVWLKELLRYILKIILPPFWFIHLYIKYIECSIYLWNCSSNIIYIRRNTIITNFSYFFDIFHTQVDFGETTNIMKNQTKPIDKHFALKESHIQSNRVIININNKRNNTNKMHLMYYKHQIWDHHNER